MKSTWLRCRHRLHAVGITGYVAAWVAIMGGIAIAVWIAGTLGVLR